METSFDLEWARFGRQARALAIDRPVFVCGLARAGTSLVARLLAAAPGAVSPAYRDMPFALAPNLWAGLSGSKRRIAAAERGHGDGLAHDLDTPEAIEEVFWRCFEGPRYLARDAVVATPPEPETLALLRRYVSLILLRGAGGRYVSKNNNNALRVASLAAAFPDALFVHPFRHPAAQAASLERQHARAGRLQQADPFRLRYANWLGHHEFGLGRLPFRFPGAPARAPGDWIGRWNDVYARLLDAAPEVRARQFFLDYDSLCASPAAVLARLAAFTGLEPAAAPAIRVAAPPDAAVPAAAAAAYRRLRDAALSPARPS